MIFKKRKNVLGFIQSPSLNAKIGKTYPKKNCSPGVLCHPQTEFDMIESCKNCKKLI
tara:strand:- start:1531 stop:1701 length:171 start_codon:yes stop_codon:yes gene_type:complete